MARKTTKTIPSFFQVLAATVKMMLTFEFGLCLSFSGIVIPALTGISNEHNTEETIHITGTQASWLGNQ